MTKLLFNLDEELLTARAYIERAEAMLAVLCEEYFSDVGANNPHTAQGRSNIIYGFEQNRVVAEIARDYAMQTRQTLDEMAALLERITDTKKLDLKGFMSVLGLTLNHSNSNMDFSELQLRVYHAIDELAAENATQTYTLTLDALARAGASLALMGKVGMEQALALLAKYSIEKINQLKPGQYEAFAADLRVLGARI